MNPTPPTNEHRQLARQVLEASRALTEFRRLGPTHRQASIHFDRLVSTLEAGALAAQRLKDADDKAHWQEWNPPPRTKDFKPIFGTQPKMFEALNWRPL